MIYIQPFLFSVILNVLNIKPAFLSFKQLKSKADNLSALKKLRLFLRFLQLDTVFLEKIGNALRRRAHPFVPLMPSGRADFAVSFNELQSVNDPQRFVDVAADGQVVDYLMADDTGFVNQKRSAERGAVFVEDAVIVRDFLGNIGDQRKFDVADAAGINRHFLPGQMRMF